MIRIGRGRHHEISSRRSGTDGSRVIEETIPHCDGAHSVYNLEVSSSLSRLAGSCRITIMGIAASSGWAKA